MLNCKNCGAPYTGGVVCEKCGNRFSDEEINYYKSEQQRENQNNKNSVKIVIIIIAVFFGLFFVSILAAIFVPAYIGYKHRAQERQTEIPVYEQYYDEAELQYPSIEL